VVCGDTWTSHRVSFALCFGAESTGTVDFSSTFTGMQGNVHRKTERDDQISRREPENCEQLLDILAATSGAPEKLPKYCVVLQDLS